MDVPRIDLCGAAGEVTGSGYLVDTGTVRVLVDFGMFQGRGATEARNRDLGPVRPELLDAVVLTHAHIDHSGRLPLLTAAAPESRWRIHATPATCDLTEILLEDSARIQESDAARDGEPPLYTAQDVSKVLGRFDPLPFGLWRTVAPGVSVRLRDSGHILGSASVEMRARVRDHDHRIVFSGDIGQRDTPLHRDPDAPDRAELMFLESTYGDRDHRPFSQTLDEFKEIICRASWEKSKVLIPSFAVGRTQILLHCLRKLYQSEECPRIPVWLDSPLATKATRLYGAYRNILDPPDEEVTPPNLESDLQSLRRSGDQPKRDPFEEQLHVVQSAQESRALNDSWEAGIIIAASGMCDGGRIVHHLKHHLWRKGVHVLMVGFMPAGSLGRRLIDGATSVRMLGRDIEVRAKIHTLGGFSAHAGKSGLIEWAEAVRPRGAPSSRIILTHGEDRARVPLSEALKGDAGSEIVMPQRGDSVALQV